MKRYVILISILFLVISSTFAQDILNYPGGTISSSTTWNGYDIVYVNGNITIGTGGTLNIAPNTTGTNAGANLPVYIVFTGTYGITITGTGALNVNGTSLRNIHFNADKNTNYIFDAGETWKNIYFSGSSGTSVIENAIIEYGTGSPGFGGGIRIIGTGITVKNSIIRNCLSSNDGGGVYARPNPLVGGIINLENLNVNNNSATTGGGIYIYSGINLTGCDISGNTATSGAGIYFRSTGSISNSKIYNHTSGQGIYSNLDDASGYITNCLISNNSVGIQFYGTRNVVNTDIVNNVTGVTSSSSIAPKLVNVVLWNTTIEYSLDAGGQLELGYCGIKGGLIGGTDGGGNKTLSSNNTDITGPNFVDPLASNFHINSWVSPLVDGGTSSYSSLSIPGTDIEGRASLITKDIGAFEFLYFVWTGGASTTVWSTPGNWQGSPSFVPTTISENKVFIPSGLSFYPTTSSLTLQNRSSLTIQPLAGLTVTGSTTVGSGCSFILKSSASGSANFITGTSVSGTFNIELFLPGGGDPNFKWHYVTTPVDGAGKVVLTDNINNPYNLLNYFESKVNTNKMEGWNWHDGDRGSTIFNTLRTDFGYNVYVSSDQTAVFSGTVLVGNEYSNTNISCGALDPSLSGWNLVGNPFTSSVDINNLTFGVDVESVVYFTKDNGYSSYNITTQQGLNGATNIISPLQGFFVHVLDGWDQYVGIPASSRIYSSQPLQKGGTSENNTKGTINYPLLKLNVSDGSSLTDETLIYFFNDATQGFDRKYDGYKMLSNNSLRPQIYSKINTIEFGMNGLPINENITTVPLRIRIGEAKNYTINILDLQNLTDCKVTLIHGMNRIDLKTNPSYTFSAVVGTISDMSIEFESLTTDIDLPSKDQTTCWYSNGSVFITTGLAGFENNSSVLIYDANGRAVYSKSNVSLGKGVTVEIPVSLTSGFYITTVLNKNIKLSKKMVIAN